MNVELVTITPEAETVIETAGRTCYQSKSGDLSIIQKWIRAGHESVIEHASATFRISEISRALTHQLVRHRIASFSQQSQRYVDEQSFQYVIPESIGNNPQYLEKYITCMNVIAETYTSLRDSGVKKEDARFVLPNACHTEIVLTMNFREFRHFLTLRLSTHAQWEIRELATAIGTVLYAHAPNVFGDIITTNK